MPRKPSRKTLMKKCKDCKSKLNDNRSTRCRDCNAKHRQKRVYKKCLHCQSEFWLYKSRINRKYCSMKCSGLHKSNQKKKTCRYCGNEFMFIPSQKNHYSGAGKYCSRDCSYKGIVKENRNKPIKDKYGRSQRKDDRDWKDAVRKRDKYTCQRCGKYDKYIHAHHIKPRSRYPELKHDVSNGICLDNSCHTWVHHHPKEATEAGLFYVGKYAI